MNHKQLLDDAINAMQALQDTWENADNENQDAIVPGQSVRVFVDAHARLLFQRNKLIKELGNKAQ